jgi:hypothetical protein
MPLSSLPLSYPSLPGGVRVGASVMVWVGGPSSCTLVLLPVAVTWVVVVVVGVVLAIRSLFEL